MSAPSPFEIDPSDVTLQVLSDIHDLKVRQTELCDRIKAFQANRAGFTGADLLKMLQASNLLLKEQGHMLTTLVEAQLTLDDRLKAMVAVMENGDTSE